MPEDDNPYAVSQANLKLEPRLVDTSPELATLGSRFLASLLDGVILSAVAVGLRLLLAFVVIPERVPTTSWAEAAYGFVVYFGSFIVVNGFTLHTRGQTLGKMALNIRIVGAKSGELVGLSRILSLRELFQVLIPSAIPIFGMLYYVIDVCFIFNEDRRCLHDLIAGTKVVKVMPK